MLRTAPKCLIFLLIISEAVFCFAQSNAVAPAASNVPVASTVSLDPRILNQDFKEEVSPVFKSIISVQRRALKKTGRYLFNPYGSIDFSDAPSTMWGLTLNVGYAPSEFWEHYITIVPSYIANDRLIVSKLKNIQVVGGGTAEINTEKAKSSYGYEVLWTPAYGKDAWGPFGVVRSDTFLLGNISMIQFTNNTGLKIKFGIGKTFFISKSWNLRLAGAGSMVQYVTRSQAGEVSKGFNFVGLFEAGLVYYF